MNITTDGDGGLDWLDVTLFNENFLYFLTENSEISFRKDGSFSDGIKPLVDILSTHF